MAFEMRLNKDKIEFIRDKGPKKKLNKKHFKQKSLMIKKSKRANRR